MPAGSAYPGPAAALAQYTAVVEAGRRDCPVKGAKNPYTSLNGHMFSFLDPEGRMALRLPDGLGEEFLGRYDSGPVMQYGAVMRGYVSVPPDLLANTDEIGGWFAQAYDWIATLEPKATKKTKKT